MVSPNTAFLVVFVLVAILFPFLAFTVAYFLSPKRPNPEKATTYESGMTTRGDVWVRFRAQYYIYAFLFVLFDVETMFLYPWAVAYNRLGLFALVEGFIFIGILAFGLAYAWAKGDLRWT
ncbi:MAG: NADH-quinone oxidoreductase subunit A [Anaerolineae bacterium]|jgi:NADH-quinone oxidoreductase subunit A